MTATQVAFKKIYNTGQDFRCDGAQFDHLFSDGESFAIGGVQAQVLHTPGHTTACVSYLIGKEASLAAFVGDTIFIPDVGTARCDFPGGDARALYRSVSKLLPLPPQLDFIDAMTIHRKDASRSSGAPSRISEIETSTSVME